VAGDFKTDKIFRRMTLL